MQETCVVPLPDIAKAYGQLCQTYGMKLLRLSVTFDQRMSP